MVAMLTSDVAETLVPLFKVMGLLSIIILIYFRQNSCKILIFGIYYF
jgi:hypothetical protein